MPRTTTPAASELSRRLTAFVTERYPFAIEPVAEAVRRSDAARAVDEAAIERVRGPFADALRDELRRLPVAADLETTPGVTGRQRLAAAVDDIVEACDGVLRRAAIRASLTPAERVEILRGMILTRATDTRLKTFFTAGEVRYGEAAFQGKGFRSLGQEAIYAAGVRLRRGDKYRRGGEWHGDVIAPVIRDLGVALAMRND